MILSNFFKTFYENVRSLPPLALFSDDKNTNNHNILSNNNNNSNATDKSYFEKVLPYPELSYLSSGSASTNSYDKRKDPLGLIEKIIESVENFAVVVIKYKINHISY